MSTLREAAIGAMGALETARNGLAWYRDRYPESTDGSDDEAAGDIDAAIDALRAELVKPDAPTVEDEPAPQMPEALRDSLQRRCVEWGVYWRAPDAHGVDLTHEQALELLRDALGVEVEIAAAPRPAPAEPQPIAAWSIVRTAESAVVTAVRAALSATPAPRPAGGEPQPAAQQEQAIENCLWARNGHARCPQQERKPLTDEWIEAAEWGRECDDTDTILRALGLDPAKCRTDGGSLKVQMIVGALADREAMLICEASLHKDRADDCGRLARMVLGKVGRGLLGEST